MAFGIVESSGHKFAEVMQMTAIEVLTLATYLIDKIEIVKQRHAGTNPKAS